MEDLTTFKTWATAQGVKVNGITTHRFPNRGLGIIAERRLEAGETILTASLSALRSSQTVSKKISKAITDPISINGLLGAEFSIDTSETRAPWRATLPTASDIKDSIPFFWDPSLQALLPSGAATLLESQKTKIGSDWSAVHRAFPDEGQIGYEDYVYNWFLISTRTFYYNSPKTKGKTRKALSRDDCIALIPLADNFNHADVGCSVEYSPTGSSGYAIISDRRYERGEEVYISYGDHNNDFLLAEYGFILEVNKWDSISLDEKISSFFSEEQKEELKDAGFLGKYLLDERGVCYRTQVALRLLCMEVSKWLRLVASGVDEKDQYQSEVDEILLKVLRGHLVEAEEMINQVGILECETEGQRQTLMGRWEQIRRLLIASIEKIQN